MKRKNKKKLQKKKQKKNQKTSQNELQRKQSLKTETNLNVDLPTVTTMKGIFIKNVEIGTKWIGIETLEPKGNSSESVLRIFKRDDMNMIFANGINSLLKYSIFTTSDFTKYSVILPQILLQRKSDNRLCSLFKSDKK
jgi:hypothetical protein